MRPIDSRHCAYRKICKGICSVIDDNSANGSCICSKKSEEEYWKEIQLAMVAVGRLERILRYVLSKPETVRLDIIEKWATLKDDNVI